MNSFCLLVADVVRATLPGSELALAWQHSVEHTRWQERYRIEAGQLALTEARVQGFGAGMEPPSGAVLRDGEWSWQPRRTLPEITLTRSSYTPDYRLCWRDDCRNLDALVGPTDEGAVVVVRPCAPESGR